MDFFNSIQDVFGQPTVAQRRFAEKGFIHIKSVFNKEVCRKAIKSIDSFENGLEKSNSVALVTETIENKNYTKYFQGAYQLGDPLRRFFSFSLLKVGSILLDGRDVYFADLEAHIRNPGGGEIPKHQDNFYFNLSEALGMTCYIALNAHNTTTGGLNYIEASHRRVIMHDQSLCPGFSSSLEYNLDDPEVRNKRIYRPEYGIGDVTIHHPNNIHFSEALEREADRRFALSARIFATEETRNLAGIERYQRLLNKNRARHA
jgi:hypothetical protein